MYVLYYMCIMHVYLAVTNCTMYKHTFTFYCLVLPADHRLSAGGLALAATVLQSLKRSD